MNINLSALGLILGMVVSLWAVDPVLAAARDTELPLNAARVADVNQIEIMHDHLGAVSARYGNSAPELIAPLLDLAQELADQQFFAEGLEHLERARVIATNAQLYSTPGEAQQFRRLCLLRVHYANWLGSRRQYRVAEAMLGEAEQDLSQAFGTDHPLLIAPLVSRAFLYGGRSYKLRERGRALERALEIAWRSDAVSAEETIELYARQGDFYLLMRKHAKAHSSYRKAWKLHFETTGNAAKTNAHFANPQVLSMSPYLAVARLPIGGADRTVEVTGQVSVGENGQAGKARVARKDLDPGLVRSARRVLSAAVFRPAIRDGKVVAVEAHSVSGRFRLILQ